MVVFSPPAHAGAPAYLLYYNEFSIFKQASAAAPKIIFYACNGGGSTADRAGIPEPS
jgi:hypothetical protein